MSLEEDWVPVHRLPGRANAGTLVSLRSNATISTRLGMPLALLDIMGLLSVERDCCDTAKAFNGTRNHSHSLTPMFASPSLSRSVHLYRCRACQVDRWVLVAAELRCDKVSTANSPRISNPMPETGRKSRAKFQPFC